jgi:UDP-N-acetylglucosamine transferase subunit ALG13
MIFVTVGTNEARFDRLLRAVAALQVDEPVLVQHGHSSPIGPSQAELVDFLTFEEMVDAIRHARAVVTHAGVGSVLVSLSNGKRPVVVPRLQKHGEAVDDHQLQLGRRFAGAGLVSLVEEPAELGAAVAAEQEAAVVLPSARTLAGELRRYLESVVLPLASA